MLHVFLQVCCTLVAWVTVRSRHATIVSITKLRDRALTSESIPSYCVKDVTLQCICYRLRLIHYSLPPYHQSYILSAEWCVLLSINMKLYQLVCIFIGISQNTFWLHCSERCQYYWIDSLAKPAPFLACGAICGVPGLFIPATPHVGPSVGKVFVSANDL